MTAVDAASDLENLGRIFAEPSAYADPVAWHAAAGRFRAERPIAKVVTAQYPDFWAITKHADVMEIERNSDVFFNSPIPAMAPKANFAAAREPRPMKTLVEMDGDEHKVHRAIVNDWF